MENYQQFTRIFKFVADSMKNPEEQEKFLYDNLSKEVIEKYKKLYGIEDKQRIVMAEMSKDRKLHRAVNLYLETCHVFEIEEKHKFLLMLTKNPKSSQRDLWKEIRLPFPEIFIDIGFSNLDDDDRIDGKINGILLKESNSIEIKGESKKKLNPRFVYGLTAYICGITLKGLPYIDQYNFPMVDDKGEEMSAHYTDKGNAKFIKEFIINFILFLKDKEVIYITRERTEKSRLRRIKNGKIPLPSSRIIKLTGEVKRYVDSIKGAINGKLNHRFWVSGHWRTYKNERYKVKGKVQWIYPFQKGEGILVKGTYKVIPKNDKRILDYDDIRAN